MVSITLNISDFNKKITINKIDPDTTVEKLKKMIIKEFKKIDVKELNEMDDYLRIILIHIGVIMRNEATLRQYKITSENEPTIILLKIKRLEIIPEKITSVEEFEKIMIEGGEVHPMKLSEGATHNYEDETEEEYSEDEKIEGGESADKKIETKHEDEKYKCHVDINFGTEEDKYAITINSEHTTQFGLTFAHNLEKFLRNCCGSCLFLNELTENDFKKINEIIVIGHGNFMLDKVIMFYMNAGKNVETALDLLYNST
jgi:hypothetical protein